LTTFLRPFLIASALLVLITFWMLHTELVTGRYVTAGVPPLPAVAALLLLIALNPLLGRLHRRLSLSRAEILLIYGFLIVAVPLLGAYMVRAFLPHLTVLSYFATPENGFRNLWDYFPQWLTVPNHEILRQCFEASDDGRVPWRFWLRPIALWMMFFVGLFLTVMCFLVIIRRQWVERERLVFPLLFLPLRMTEGDGAGFFKNPLMWMGFGIAAVHNLFNIAHAFNPAVPALGFYYNVGQFFTERPLSSLQPLLFFFMPEAVGFGYFMSLEIAFSVWVFYLLNKATALGATVVGYEKAGFPFVQEQSAGGYIAVGLFLLWAARHQIRQCLRKAFWNDKRVDDSNEPMSYRVAVFGFIAGLIFILTWMRAAGLSLIVAVPYVVILLLFTLVFARIRAETGAPFEFLYPYGLPKAMILNATGTATLMNFGGLGTLTAFSAFAWLSRHHFPEMMGAYQLDNFKLGESTRIRGRVMMWMLLLGLLLGLGCAFWVHLTAYYQYGQNIVEGGSGLGDYRARVAVMEYEAAAKAAQTPVLPDIGKTAATGVGFVIALTLTILRSVFLRFPLHPLGYVIGTAYGIHTPFWGPFLTVWAVKSLILKLGGSNLYKRLTPIFLGLILGHFFTAGIVWTTWSLFISEEVSKRYHLWFG
jgi:hypothetical protein